MNPDLRVALTLPGELGRSRSPQPCPPGCLNGDGSESSSRLQRLTAAGCARRRPGLQPQVREDLLDHRLLQDRRNDLQLAAAVRAVLQLEIESAALAKTNLYSSYVVAKTRLSSLAQLRRTGRWCMQFASHSAGFASCAGASASCGTTSARSLALGARTPCSRSGDPLTSRSEVMRTPKRNQVQPRAWHQRRQPLHELQRRHHQVRGPVAPGGLQLEYHLARRVGLYALS